MATITKGKTFTSNETVTPTKLNDLVDKATISGIVNADIASLAVTTAKIADSNVTTAKIADSNVTTAKIADSNVTTAKIADANVTTTKIADANVTTAKIASLAVTTAKIADANVTTTKIADSNVTTAKIANGSVTAAKLGSDIFLVPTGAVMPFAMNSAPAGWLAANGAAVSRTTYATLFSAIGTIYGAGNGSTTFTLPDLRGYFVRGAGTNTDGSASGSFGVKQADEFKAHTHTYTQPDTPVAYYDDNNDEVGVRTLTANKASGPAGGTETRPKNIAMLYCIKF
jgi:microcystin-dependent protein